MIASDNGHKKIVHSLADKHADLNLKNEVIFSAYESRRRTAVIIILLIFLFVTFISYVEGIYGHNVGQ